LNKTENKKKQKRREQVKLKSFTCEVTRTMTCPHAKTALSGLSQWETTYGVIDTKIRETY
jgi:hypothetical protein